MIETTQTRGEDGVLITFCEFTEGEAGAMAKFIMDCLCLPWIDTYPEFNDLLHEIFQRCSKGSDMTHTHACRLADKYERYFKYGLPRFPKITEGSRIVCPNDIHGPIDTSAWLVNKKSEVWRDQWENHVLVIKGVNGKKDKKIENAIRRIGGYWKFPGDGADAIFLEKQNDRELLFWAEVDSRHEEYGCSRSAAIRAVADYMQRAESENQLSDPSIVF